MKTKFSSLYYLGLLGCIIAVVIAASTLSAGQIKILWLITAVAIILFTLIISKALTGRFWEGWMINEQNRMSLSRFQMFLWTVLILSAFLSAVIVNIKHGFLENSMDIAIPQQIWWTLGIATTSLVGSPLILATKKDKKTNTTVAAKSIKRIADPNADALNTPTVADNFVGHLHANTDSDHASFYELFSGEETSNVGFVDLSRLQNFFFTIVLVGVYGATIGGILTGESGAIIDQFPAISSGMATMLGISHAGYLVSKAVDKQPEGN